MWLPSALCAFLMFRYTRASHTEGVERIQRYPVRCTVGRDLCEYTVDGTCTESDDCQHLMSVMTDRCLCVWAVAVIASLSATNS